MSMKDKDYIFALGAVLVLTGAVLQISMNNVAPYLVGAGSLIIFVFRIIYAPKTDDFKVRRLRGMQFISSCLLVASAYLMFTNNPPNAWALTLFLAAFLDIFIAFRMPKEKDC